MNHPRLVLLIDLAEALDLVLSQKGSWNVSGMTVGYYCTSLGNNCGLTYDS